MFIPGGQKCSHCRVCQINTYNLKCADVYVVPLEGYSKLMAFSYKQEEAGNLGDSESNPAEIAQMISDWSTNRAP